MLMSLAIFSLNSNSKEALNQALTDFPSRDPSQVVFLRKGAYKSEKS